jgi:cell division protease FtsH
VSAGAFQDLKEANQLAKQMITDFGMGSSDLEVFSSLNSDNIISGNGAYSEYLISSIDKNCLAIINYAYKNITEVLEKNKDKIIELKNKLVDKKVLYNNDIELV